MPPQTDLLPSQVKSNHEQKLKEQVRKGDNIAALMVRMVEKWPSSIVARAAVSEITGGVYTRGSMANFDSQGSGPDAPFVVGKQVAYDTWAFAHWLYQKSRLLEPPSKGKDIGSLMAVMRR